MCRDEYSDNLKFYKYNTSNPFNSAALVLTLLGQLDPPPASVSLQLALTLQCALLHTDQ